jgi:hypothetical protein
MNDAPDARRSRGQAIGWVLFGLAAAAFIGVFVVWPVLSGGGGSNVNYSTSPGAVVYSPSPTASPTPSATKNNGASSPVATVYLLDGSGARECIVSNASWAAQIEKLGGPTVRARDLGNTNQTFLQDGMLVGAMPKEKALVLIGLSIGRYTGEPNEGADGYDPGAVLASDAEINHHYSLSQVLSDGRKRGLLDEWLTDRYPVFQQTNAANTAELDKLVKECLDRKLHPVLLELPLNLDIVGTSLDEPRTTYRKAAHKVASTYNVPYVDFVADVELVNGDFYDLMHLVEPGRLKWQKRLSTEVVALLEEYGIGKP